MLNEIILGKSSTLMGAKNCCQIGLIGCPILQVAQKPIVKFQFLAYYYEPFFKYLGMKNVVKCWKDFQWYFAKLVTYSVKSWQIQQMIFIAQFLLFCIDNYVLKMWVWHLKQLRHSHNLLQASLFMSVLILGFIIIQTLTFSISRLMRFIIWLVLPAHLITCTIQSRLSRLTQWVQSMHQV